ncbi:sensor histidine kinase [Flavobacterium seoulense]|uniref:histidine kinase n=1 Tax=Flavobacterium seoulense TaxID=1492738 RepID=A0A066WX84_9FLAO|nr:HAMP domain-containing sensor histidine kinase [Flavobacterium seoulense]KDN55554.1 histidine kinase [Flavobacterium seoulense]
MFKFLFVAFIGIHIPLIGILFFVLYAKANFSTEILLLFSLVMTLIATAVTLMVLKKLVHPIELASKALNDYKRKRIIPNLPLHYSDEAGLLLFNIHNSIQESEDFIAEKQDLIYLLSHDLRTFASNPKSLAQMIIGTNPSSEVKELAELICDSSKDQFQYIENFIRLLKEQDEMLKTSSDIKTMNLDELIEKVKDQLNQKLSSKNIQLVKKLEVENITLRIDPELLTRVFFNLVNNAIKFSFENATIQLESYIEQKNVHIKVIDEGIGFDNKDVDKMFAKFTKMNRLGTMNEYSTGIGLYLSRQVIERSEGQLTATSEGKNKGGTFTIMLPLIK